MCTLGQQPALGQAIGLLQQNLVEQPPMPTPSHGKVPHKSEDVHRCIPWSPSQHHAQLSCLTCLKLSTVNPSVPQKTVPCSGISQSEGRSSMALAGGWHHHDIACPRNSSHFRTLTWLFEAAPPGTQKDHMPWPLDSLRSCFQLDCLCYVPAFWEQMPGVAATRPRYHPQHIYVQQVKVFANKFLPLSVSEHLRPESKRVHLQSFHALQHSFCDALCRRKSWTWATLRFLLHKLLCLDLPL
mmetsp:Transcript_30733/g.77751  ORF Transcript_30733/g.77751 Transcript_30733/m.77751 type:complete len:241 (-) Transcript_30733:542-1264(-)